ncbi:putative sugar phosphate/phosphate translocator [Symbiodinium microadriaticum]|uniref:Putative sugar phosphate/phosphate translocator n=1 Tax=Symbiodinium microadriaticum TaxID=2951 RepID=A0A1Q9DX60_SYMMI|nr:putative sugar phosphate/phosphate translocator [Symbiodinium microadriaticum]
MPSGAAPSDDYDETKQAKKCSGHSLNSCAFSQGTWRRQLETAAVVTSWFVLNITIASSTKWIFVHGRICSVPCHANHLHEHFYEHLNMSIYHVALAPPSQLVRCDKAWTQASSRSLGTMTRQTLQLETSVFVRSWGLALNSTSHVHRPIHTGRHIHNLKTNDKGCTTYQYPVAITVIHMIFSWMLCRVYIFQLRRGKALGLAQQAREIMPLSLCFALSVAMGNLSLKYIYPSFNQMLGPALTRSMSPLITVLLAVVMQQKRFPLKTWLSMPVICVGLAVCSAKELNFNALGAFYASGATVLRAVKSLIQGRYYMAPWAAMWLTLIMLFMEAGTDEHDVQIPSFSAAPGKGGEPLFLLLTVFDLQGLGPDGDGGVTGAGQVLSLLMLSGLNACLLNIANFLVTSYTSPVTLQVLGNVKSCLSIAVSVAIFRNSLTLEQAIGVCTCLIGVWMYNQKAAADAEPLEIARLGGRS